MHQSMATKMELASSPNVELLLQHRMASIVELVSSQVAALEPAVAALTEKEKDLTGINDSDERVHQSDATDSNKANGTDQKPQTSQLDKISETKDLVTETQDKETQDKETQDKETQDKETQDKETQDRETQDNEAQETQDKETQEKITEETQDNITEAKDEITETQDKETQDRETQDNETQEKITDTQDKFTEDKLTLIESAGTSSPVTGLDVHAIECRLSGLETKMNNLNPGNDTEKRNLDVVSIEKRLDALERHMERQQKLEETVEQMTERLAKLWVVCQKLITQIKGPLKE